MGGKPLEVGAFSTFTFGGIFNPNFVSWLLEETSNINFPPQVAADVISGVVVDPPNVDVRVKVGDSRSNRFRDMRLLHFGKAERRRRTSAHRSNKKPSKQLVGQAKRRTNKI